MIQMIGAKRLLAILLLLGLNVAAAAAWFTILEPLRVEAEAERDRVDREIRATDGKIKGVRAEIELLKENMPKYEALQAGGFFMEQDRFELGRLLEDFRAQANLMGFSYDISEIQPLQSADAQASGHKLVSSAVRINKVTAYNDTAFLIFAQDLAARMPGHARVAEISFRRSRPVDKTTLNDITTRKPTSMIDASLTFDWVTLQALPKEDEVQQQGFRGR